MKIDPVLYLGLWHFAIATDTSSDLASDRFYVGGHPLSVQLLKGLFIAVRYCEPFTHGLRSRARLFCISKVRCGHSAHGTY